MYDNNESPSRKKIKGTPFANGYFLVSSSELLLLSLLHFLSQAVKALSFQKKQTGHVLKLIPL